MKILEVQKLETSTVLIDCHAQNNYQGGPLTTDTFASPKQAINQYIEEQKHH